MARIRRALTLKHRANLGEAPTDIEFERDEPVVVLKEWADRYLCKNAAGLLFNVPKEYVEP